MVPAWLQGAVFGPQCSHLAWALSGLQCDDAQWVTAWGHGQGSGCSGETGVTPEPGRVSPAVACL